MSVTSIGTGLAMPVAGVIPAASGRGSAPQAQILPLRTRTESAGQREAAIPGTDSGGQSAHQLHSVTADLEQISLAFNKKLQFVVDHRSNEVTVKVIDKETDKVVKELPPEELQHLHSKLRETLGFLFDERV